MKKNHFLKASCAFLLLSVGLLLASCAQDGFNDETFVSDVWNTQLVSPDESGVTYTSSADGKSLTFEWPVVHGAGGYLVSLYCWPTVLDDEGNPTMDRAEDTPEEIVVADSVIDGCSVKLKREENKTYRFEIRTLGDEKKNNLTAETSTLKKFTTYLPTYKTIPSGEDLNDWFAKNPIPDKAKTEMLVYDLEAGGEYTVSGVLDFNQYKVLLRSNQKSNHPTITYTAGNSCITFAEAFQVRYIDFDCSGQVIETNGGVFAFSKNPRSKKGTEINKELYKWENPLIEQPVSFTDCNFKNVKGYFFWDNQQKVCAMIMLIDECLVHLAPEKKYGGGVFWTNKGGHINDLYVTNSTFYELPDCKGDYKYFYQAGMVCSEDIFQIKETATNSVNYTNSTFYHICWNEGEWGNYNRMAGRACSHWLMTDCIFYDCSTKGSVPRRFLHGKKYTGDLAGNVVFNYNTYMKNDGTFQDIQSDGTHEYDLSGTWIEEDPVFANPANGDFHISGPSQVAHKTGDPRWLP